MGFDDLLPMWLKENAKDLRRRAALAERRLAGFVHPSRPFAVALAEIARCHREAAAIYESALPAQRPRDPVGTEPPSAGDSNPSAAAGEGTA